MSEKKLNEESITFGKYKDLTLSRMLKDRKYCKWLLGQQWFKNQYEFLYNKVFSFQPISLFLTKPKLEKYKDINDFLENYPYFYLKKQEELSDFLSEMDKKCYSFYLLMVKTIKEKIENEMTYNIKAPTGWLKNFEKTFELDRETFKEFLQSYELPNITSLIEEIKNFGGIEYKGAKSYIIAKQNSVKQEKFWEQILKKYYGEDIGSQFKFHNCFFDFIRIKESTLYECKLSIKDFDKFQFEKYKTILENYTIIYLVGYDCIINFKENKVWTTCQDKYQNLNKFKIITLNCIEDYFK